MTVLLTAGVVLIGCGSGTAADSDTTTATDAADAPATSRSEPGPPRDDAAASSRAIEAPAVSTVARGLDVPWGVAFLPNGDALVAERGGRVRRIAKDGNRLSTVGRLPGVEEQGEGGLLGLAVSPRYARDRWIYAYMTTSRDNRIVRFKLNAPRTLRTVVSGLESGAIHNGGRIAFGPDGKLYAGVGDVGDGDLAQDRGSQSGKILRMNPNGSVPKDNPIRGSRVWSLGHRNVQGLTWDERDRLWAAEFGQNTYDEINLIRKGRNYGWPDVEGKGTGGGKYVSPKVVWSTSEASPSGVTFLNGALWVAALGGERLWRVPLNGTRTGKPQALYVGDYGRIRTTVAAPDGSLWITTSNRDGRGDPADDDDRILRVDVKG
ncbi:MAG: PQQ-dependent sugar dehydrogenase [Patulibacter sp.]|nr:PQQ-dependent sugar dehydrogenase [Patulibacter sp.]